MWILNFGARYKLFSEWWWWFVNHESHNNHLHYTTSDLSGHDWNIFIVSPEEGVLRFVLDRVCCSSLSFLLKKVLIFKDFSQNIDPFFTLSRCSHENLAHVCLPVIWVVVVLRSPIHANEPSEYNGMLYRTCNRVLNNGIKVIILICMDGTSQYHHHRNRWVQMYSVHALSILGLFYGF